MIATCIAYLAKYLIKLIVWTCRVELHGLKEFCAFAEKEKTILIIWHNRLTLIAEILTTYAPQLKYAALISKSKDAEPLAILADSYRNGRAIRVPHDARKEALNQAITRLRFGKEVIVLTPDGPRGPLYQVKPGVAIAASAAKAAVIPMSWSASSAWQFNTWDKLLLPKPFSRIAVVFGPPISITNEEETELLQEALLQLNDASKKRLKFAS